VHFRSDSTAAPVTNETTIKIILITLTLTEWEWHVIDVKGAFLKGRFNDGEEMNLQISQGFEIYYEKGTVIKLQRTIYGLKQAVFAFCCEWSVFILQKSREKLHSDLDFVGRWLPTNWSQGRSKSVQEHDAKILWM
jgi:hypothetical protein